MAITPESVKELIYSPNFGERIRGINELRQLDKEKAYELIKPIIKDDNVRVRYAAISQLDTLGDVNLEESLEILLERLYNDPESDVRAAAADAIAGLKLTQAFPDLKKVYYESDDWLIQFSIVAALGELGHPDGFDLLSDALNSDNGLLQTAAISALGELGDIRAISLLIPFVNNDDWQIRHRLAQALSKFAGEEKKEVLNTLTILSQDKSVAVAEEAKNYLTNIAID
ncbi:phycocyanin alpha phycocyanobilin lyase related protein NblB [Geminocystis sp. NIES-3708]|uniref:phycobilisome degradation protein NblB n=1 Tax=Geminocystis sp. NIES-3708 TaxID=1615909 RepID=UPI0005FC98BC|nr:HEAT repeat domain-containing protein [Geminocystis sp. NIES-3708]BAQ63074.1 phycocyanin alpha phycocyanobilin lyase related protein NblB [Geminocystis sp. NIES-3708]